MALCAAERRGVRAGAGGGHRLRRAFISALVDLAAADERVVLLTADLGYTVVEPFAERFPSRFLNVGVAEQNMIGAATGLADAGYVPYVYSIAPFATLRPYEFIRNGPIHHGLPVRIVGVGAGFDYGHNGISHYALEDVAVLRVQPGVAVVAPADARRVSPALSFAHEWSGAAYIRLARDDAVEVPGLSADFAPGAQVTRAGGDVALIALGNAAADASAAADLLAAQGVRAQVMVVEIVSPLDADAIAAALATVRVAVVAEGHYVNGGLGSAVCEVVAEQVRGCRVVRAGVEALSPQTGSDTYLRQHAGIDAGGLAARALTALGA